MCILFTGNLLTIKNTKPQDIISTCPYFKIGKKSEKKHGQSEKIKLYFYFHTSLWYLKRFYEGL